VHPLVAHSWLSEYHCVVGDAKGTIHGLDVRMLQVSHSCHTYITLLLYLMYTTVMYEGMFTFCVAMLYSCASMRDVRVCFGAVYMPC
jgi:hypothetical protein